MKRNFFIALILGASLMACSKQYYPQMYEKAGIDESENVFIDEEDVVLAPIDSIKIDSVMIDSVVNKIDSVITKMDSTIVKTEKIVESTDKYTTEDGAEVVYAYHVVVGSFASRVNATNLSIELNKSGVKATVAVNQNGLYRVFYYSTDNEPEVRQVLAKARKKYPDAWMLKLVAK